MSSGSRSDSIRAVPRNYMSARRSDDANQGTVRRYDVCLCIGRPSGHVHTT